MKAYYSVMIVEKQEQMIHVIKNMLPWNEYGFEIVATTNNEDKALAYYGEYRHDLVFTSIDLEAGNGMSLIRQVKHLNPHGFVIVISKHDDYDTLRDAFKAGCNDYLLKERLRYSTLANLLKDVKKALDEDKEVKHFDIDWENELEKLLGLIRDKQKVDTSSVIKLLEREELMILQGEYRFIYFRMDNVRIFNRNLKQYDKPSWLSTDEFINMFRNKLFLRDEMQLKLKQIIKKIFKDVPNMRLIFTKKHSGLIILPDDDMEFMKNKARDLIEEINRILTYEFSITISSVASGVQGFLPMYEAIQIYHEHKFYDGDSCIEIMDEMKTYAHLNEHDIYFIERIIQAFNDQQYDDVLRISKEAVHYMQQHKIEQSEVKLYFCELIDRIEKMILEKSFSQLYPFDVLRQGIRESESIMYLDLEIEKIMKTLIDWMQEHMISKYKRNVVSIMQYVEDHINQKITLAMIAEAIGLSEIHTSRIFKKETGKNLITYINEMKMKKAEILLKEERYKIKDIGHMVGIDDQLYFNKVFKKFYGYSPREYRKMTIQKG